jgi:hypothetical protein
MLAPININLLLRSFPMFEIKNSQYCQLRTPLACVLFDSSLIASVENFNYFILIRYMRATAKDSRHI